MPIRILFPRSLRQPELDVEPPGPLEPASRRKEIAVPRVLRKKKKARLEERPLNGREYFRIRLFPEGFYPEWACAQVETQMRRIASMPGAGVPLPTRPTLEKWLDRRAAFKKKHAAKQKEYEAYLVDPQKKPKWIKLRRYLTRDGDPVI
jgi:hypothetical protein